MRVTKVEGVPGSRVAYDLSVEGTTCYFVGSGILAHNCHVRYVDGIFTQALTRGDGTIGEDITGNVARMQGVLAKLPKPFTGSLRGEIVLTKSNLARYFPGKANTRNTAAGTAKRYDGTGCEHLTVLFYKVADGKDFTSDSEQFIWLEKMGLRTPAWYVVRPGPLGPSPQSLWDEYQKGTRDKLDYDIDGLVVAINDTARQIGLGEKDGRPLGVVAFKFAPVARETTLREIIWQVGGSGRITPVAVFDAVNLLGAQVTQASLYNVKYITDQDILVGSRILVARAGDVIPRVLRVIAQADSDGNQDDALPKTCPSCGHEVVMEGEYLVCPNTAGCPAQAVGRIKRYIAGLDIKDWGDVLIEKLVSSRKVGTPSDLYHLDTFLLSEMDRISEPLAAKLLALLWEKAEQPLEVLLGSLSIPLCSNSTIRAVLDAGIDTWEKLQVASIGELQQVPGVGPAKAEALVLWLIQGRKIVDDLLAAGVRLQNRTYGVLTGVSICFTGKSVMKRADLEALVSKHGGTVKTSVGRGLTYLVMADPASGSSKAKAAVKNGTQCITEEALLKMVQPV